MVKRTQNIPLIERVAHELTSVFDSIRDPVFVHDEKFRIVRANKAYADKAGMGFHELIGKPYWKIFPKITKDVVECIGTKAQCVLEDEGKTAFQQEISTKEGEIYRDRFYTSADDKLQPLFTVHILEDITKQRLIENSLAESQERFRLICASAKDAIILTDADSGITYVNDAANEMFGYDDLTMQQKGFFDLFLASPLIESYKKDCANFAKDGQCSLIGKELELIATNSEDAPFAVEIYVSSFQINNQWQLLAIVSDITERRKNRMQLEYQLEFERVISNVAKKLAQLDVNDLFAGIEYILRSIGKYVSADRSYIFTFSPDKSQLDCVAEWTDPHIGKKMSETPIIAREKLSWICDNIGSAETLFIPDVAQLNDVQAVNDKAELLRRNVKTLLLLPLRHENELIGFWGLDSTNVKKVWQEQEILLLLTITELLMQTMDRIDAHKKEEAHVEKFDRALLQTIQAMAFTIEKRDPYTSGHQQRVAKLCVAIGEELQLSEQQIQGLRLGALIHDIGKIYIPSEILNRPGVLSKIEFDLIKDHPQTGYDILKTIEFPWPVAAMVLQHHERIDGSGYPQGLMDGEICLEARILAVADVVEAITSHRPYRPALGVEAALTEITNNRGSLYDADVVDACIRLFEEKRFEFEKE